MLSEPAMKKFLPAVNIRKTDKTSVSPGGGQLSQGGNNFTENLLSSLKLLLGFIYLLPGVLIPLVHCFYLNDQ